MSATSAWSSFALHVLHWRYPKSERNKTPNRGSLGVLWTYSGSSVVPSWDLTHKNTQTSTQTHACRVTLTLARFNNMHPSITIYFNSPIHTFLCIIPAGGFTYCTGLPSCARARLLRTIKWLTISKENNQQFSVGMDDVLETNKAAFTSNISQLFINACKLQLRDHTMVHFSLTKPILQPPTN